MLSRLFKMPFFTQITSQMNKFTLLEQPHLVIRHRMDNRWVKFTRKKGKLTPEQARFMASTRPAEELYDLRKDHDELHNLADVTAYKDELLKHRKIMDQWLQKYDKGQYPEEPKEIQYWTDFFRKRYQKKLKDRALPPDVTDEQLLQWWEKELGINQK